MAKRREPGKRERQDPVLRVPSRVGHETHAAGIVLESRIVEPRCEPRRDPRPARRRAAPERRSGVAGPLGHR